MSKMTDREINIAALKHAVIRVFALVLVLAINFIFMVKIGWDIRNWQWWLIVPALSIMIPFAVLSLEQRK